MPIVIRSIDYDRHELDAIALGSIHYKDVEKHLVEERIIGGISFKEFMDGREAKLAFALTPSEIRQIFALVRNLCRECKFGPTAVLVSDEFALGIMRAMEVLLEDVAEIRAFRDERLARSWLASKAA